jgi:hypothetical protein
VNVNVLQGGFSFVGVAFTTEQVARVRIINGSTALGPNDSPNDGGIDVVALDDFIYAEPRAIVPAPASVLLLGIGVMAVAWLRSKRGRTPRASMDVPAPS